MFPGISQAVSQIAQGTPVYVFNRKDFTVATASVTSVSQPHVPKAAQANPALMMQGFVVDVFLNFGADSTSIEFPVNSVSANYPDKGWFVSADPMLVTREVENAISNSKQYKAQLPYHDMVIEKGPSLIMQLNPDKRVEAEQASRIASLESMVTKIYERMNQMAGAPPASVPVNNHKSKKEE